MQIKGADQNSIYPGATLPIQLIKIIITPYNFVHQQKLLIVNYFKDVDKNSYNYIHVKKQLHFQYVSQSYDLFQDMLSA